MFVAQVLIPGGELLQPATITIRLTLALLLVGFAYPIFKRLHKRVTEGTDNFLLFMLYGSILVHLVLRYTVFDYREAHYFWMEYVQAGLLATSGIVLLLLGMTLMRANRYNPLQDGGGLYSLYGFLLVFVAMEEIDWGQHVFAWNVPAVLTNIFGVRDFNLHGLFASYLPEAWTVFFSATLLVILACKPVLTIIRCFVLMSDIHPLTLLPKLRELFVLEFAIILLIALGEGELAEEVFAITNLFVTFAIVAMVFVERNQSVLHPEENRFGHQPTNRTRLSPSG